MARFALPAIHDFHSMLPHQLLWLYISVGAKIDIEGGERQKLNELAVEVYLCGIAMPAAKHCTSWQKKGGAKRLIDSTTA